MDATRCNPQKLKKKLNSITVNEKPQQFRLEMQGNIVEQVMKCTNSDNKEWSAAVRSTTPR
jgi:hypothetical protein